LEKGKFDLIEQTYVSILAKKDNGNYAYESVLKERPVRSEAISIDAAGFEYSVPTSAPGNYVLQIHDESGRVWNKLSFSVVGLGEVSRALDKNSELQVKLNRSSCNAGDEIEIALTAPYTGSGLITIESDKVYAHQWFTSSTTSSVQHIRVPEGFDGTGYVNVSFVRALDSKEIFMSPLSYAVVPLTVNKAKRQLQVDLRASDPVARWISSDVRRDRRRNTLLPRPQQQHVFANHLVCWANDIASLAKEIEEGKQNIILPLSFIESRQA
jgi:hypothetical protein